uniref:glutathione-specific gamma-glutamylcyclotransferase n=2 Tax=Guillardia theta TaxID=55529 RepID=A0A7S4L427_GUITH|mmetsp:Transcript_37065/g.116646  ORF Transcript_37065/g.116646 Transcript_37065/m.116646 type:complete len:341 (+) Transcript_37065:62-1084(+)
MKPNLQGMVWVFGYGSLVWKPPEGFRASTSLPAAIKGWKRRLWQGSTDHRGVPQRPGLVATLIETSKLRESEGNKEGEDELCWGMCYGYEEEDREKILAYLDYREKDGYDRLLVDVFLPKDRGGAELEAQDCASISNVLLYIATTDNKQFLGPLSEEQVAETIASSVGPSGTNAEYLLKLAEALRGMRVRDEHVFRVEQLVEQLPTPPVGARVSAFEGCGRYRGDGGWMLQKLWDVRSWLEVPATPGMFRAPLAPAASADEVLKSIGWPPSMRVREVKAAREAEGGRVTAAHFPCGGGLMWSQHTREQEESFLLLLTESAWHKEWARLTEGEEAEERLLE